MLQEIFLLLMIILGVLIFALLAGRILTQRPKPDAPDNPGNYGMTYEDVGFPSRYKVMLRGWWIPAPNARGTIIFAHGQNGSMEGDLPQAVPLHQAGYNLLLFNFRAHGTSDGKTMTFGVFEKEDLLGAVDYVCAAKGVDRVAVIGFSMGAAVGMISAALTDKIAVLVVDGIFYRFLDTVERWLRQRYVPPILSAFVAQLVVIGASTRTNTRMFQVSPRLWARHVENVPVLFIHGEKDPLVDVPEIEKLAADLKAPSQIWVAPRCDHREAFFKHPTEYMQRVLSWLETHYR